MQNSITPSGASTIPNYLLELPESVIDAPPVEPRVPELPFEQLSWRDFERLVFRLARTDADVVYCAPYGRSGQAQHGIDVYARMTGGGHTLLAHAAFREHLAGLELATWKLEDQVKFVSDHADEPR